MLLLPSVALTSINQLTVRMSVRLSTYFYGRCCVRERQKTGRGFEGQAMKLLFYCLHRLQLYTYHQAVWPYGHICLKGDVILIIYPFLLISFPKSFAAANVHCENWCLQRN